MEMTLRVLELYCGIGGMHFALERLGRPYEVVAAMEINATALETYTHNFPGTPAFNRNILSLSSKEINLLRIDMIVLSPPCQPFCRSGLQKDTEDARTDSFCHILKILPEVKFQYILLENVKGFETSEAHTRLVECLGQCGFKCQEFLITPTAVGIPNSRLRYYLLGKRADLPWCFSNSEEIQTEIPRWAELSDQGSSPYTHLVQTEKEIWDERRKKLLLQCPSFPASGFCVGDILESLPGDEQSSSKSSIPQGILLKYYEAMDIVNLHSTRTCCFTKSYGTFVKGTGSILDTNSPKLQNTTPSAGALEEPKLRFFTPKEVSRLMCFPDSFTFPQNISVKQQYKALGNSINVYVVSILLSILLAEE